jgi:hypothetical protein
MRAILLVALLALAVPARAQPATEAQLVQLVRDAVKAEDTGDPQAARFYAPTQSITDAIPPFHWHGPDAHQRWLAAIARDFEVRNRANGSLTLAEPTTVRIGEAAAYLVFPASFAYTEANALKSQPVTVTVSLVKAGTDWKISSWTWSGAN